MFDFNRAIKSYWARLTNPPLSGNEVRGFWEAAFRRGWKKSEVLEMLRRRFGVAYVADLPRRQLKSVLQFIQTEEVNPWTTR